MGSRGGVAGCSGRRGSGPRGCGQGREGWSGGRAPPETPERRRGGRAAAGPARKENLLPAEAVRSPLALSALRLLGVGRPGPAPPIGEEGRALHVATTAGTALSRRERGLVSPFLSHPLRKCPMQLPGRAGISGAPSSCPPRNSNESLTDQHHFTSWNELPEMGTVLLDPTCNSWLLLHGDYFFKPAAFLIV